VALKQSEILLSLFFETTGQAGPQESAQDVCGEVRDYDVSQERKRYDGYGWVLRMSVKVRHDSC